MKVFSWMTVLWIAGFAIAQAKALPPMSAVLQTPDVTISGRITLDEGAPLPLPEISFLQAGKTIGVATIERDGTFRLTLPAGDYTVTVNSLPGGYVLRSLLHGSVDLRTNPLRLAGALQELQIVIGLSAPATFVRVSGQVSGSERLPSFGFNAVILEQGLNILPLKAPIRMDGRFEFSRVLPGNYTARVVDASEGPIAGARPVAVRVDAGSDLSGLVLDVPALVPLTGHIQVEGPGVPPYLSLFFTSSDGRSFSSNISNEDGSVRTQVVPGEYRVRVLTISAGYTVTGVTKDAVDVLSGTIKVEPNTPVDLVIGVRSTSKVVSVSGRVIRTSDVDPPPGRITLYPPLNQILTTGVLGPRALTAAVRSDGSFEFSNVIPGSYLIDVEFAEATRGDHLTTMLHEPHALLVGDVGATGVEVRIPRHLRLTARFVVEGGGPMPRPLIETEYVRTVPTMGGRLSGLRPGSNETQWTILPEGAYRFTVRGLPPGYVVKSMLQSGREVLNQTFQLSPDSRELVVVIGTTVPLRKVRGRVIDSPNPGSTSSQSVTLGTRDLMEIETTVGPDGRFEFPKVPAGTYFVGVESSTGSMSPAQVAIGDGPMGEPRITVGEKDIEDLRVRSTTAVTAFVGRGRVVVEGGGPMPRFSLVFNGGGGSIEPSSIDGTFQAWMPVGSSKVEVRGLPKEYVLKAVTYGEINLRQTELVLRASDVNTNLLRIVVEPSGIPWKRVAGRLMGSEGVGGQPLRISISSLAQNVDTAVMPDGSFEFPQVLSGTYNATLQIGNPVASVGLRAQIVVADENVLALELSAPRPLTLNIVTDGGTLPADPLHLWIGRRDSENRWLDYRAVDGSARGYFITGDRLEINRVPFGYRVRAVTLGTMDLLKDAIRFDNPLASQISIVLESAPADPQQPEFTLKGRVQSASNPARRRITATYVGGVNLAVMYTMMETFVRDDGSFQFERLRAGPYEIRIVGRPEVSRFVVPDESGGGAILTIP